MSNLVIKSKSRMDNLRFQLAKQRGETEKFDDKDTIVLADFSGSMYRQDATNAAGALDLRINVVIETLQTDFPEQDVLYFGSTSEQGKGKHAHSFVTQVGGGTALTEAVERARARGYKRLILLTDGEPNNEVSALRALRGIPCHAFYIGSPPRPRFFDLLARQQKSEGHVTIHKMIDLKKQGELKNAIKGLIGEGSDEDKKPIAL